MSFSHIRVKNRPRWQAPPSTGSGHASRRALRGCGFLKVSSVLSGSIEVSTHPEEAPSLQAPSRRMRSWQDTAYAVRPRGVDLYRDQVRGVNVLEAMRPRDQEAAGQRPARGRQAPLHGVMLRSATNALDARNDPRLSESSTSRTTVDLRRASFCASAAAALFGPVDYLVIARNWIHALFPTVQCRHLVRRR